MWHRKILFFLHLMLLCFFTFQLSKLSGQIHSIDFGVPIIDTIELPNEGNYITKVELYVVNKSDSKKFFQTGNIDGLRLELVSEKKLTVIGKKKNKHAILIPPLVANRFYQIRITYVGVYNIYNIFREIHNEGIDLYEDNKNWMEILRILNSDNDLLASSNFPIIARPQFFQLATIKKTLIDESYPNKFKTNSFTKKDSIQLVKILTSELKVLKFKKTKSDTLKLFEYAKIILDTTNTDSDKFQKFTEIFSLLPDYLELYEFYKNKLIFGLNNKDFSNPIKFMNFVKEAAKEENKRLKMLHKENNPNYILPNFLQDTILESIIIHTENANNLTTFSYEFKTNFERVLTPDFGYLVYLPYEGSLNGGTPYFGVHISLNPINKNIPIRLSNLRFKDRLSIHTGITLNSLAKENVREDFFNKYSLFGGLGVKFLTHSTRINFGGVLLKEKNPFSGQSNLKVQPYIGLSIDFEIRKWIENIIPNFPTFIPK